MNIRRTALICPVLENEYQLHTITTSRKLNIDIISNNWLGTSTNITYQYGNHFKSADKH